MARLLRSRGEDRRFHGLCCDVADADQIKVYMAAAELAWEASTCW